MPIKQLRLLDLFLAKGKRSKMDADDYREAKETLRKLIIHAVVYESLAREESADALCEYCENKWKCGSDYANLIHCEVEQNFQLRRKDACTGSV